jgi:hypothetical protein
MTNQNAPFLIEGQPRFAAGTPPFHGCLSLSQENCANAPNMASELHKTCARPWNKLIYFSKKAPFFAEIVIFWSFFMNLFVMQIVCENLVCLFLVNLLNDLPPNAN